MKDTRNRVSLTLPPELDAVLGRLASGMGTGKASVVTSFMLESIEGLIMLADAVDLAKKGQVDAYKVMEKALDKSLSEGHQLKLSISKKRRAMPRLKK